MPPYLFSKAAQSWPMQHACCTTIDISKPLATATAVVVIVIISSTADAYPIDFWRQPPERRRGAQPLDVVYLCQLRRGVRCSSRVGMRCSSRVGVRCSSRAEEVDRSSTDRMLCGTAGSWVSESAPAKLWCDWRHKMLWCQ